MRPISTTFLTRLLENLRRYWRSRYNKMIPPACQKKTNERKVKVEEYRKKAVFLNEARSEFVITRVDGCVIKDGVRSDWVVTRLAIGDVIVELKGVDVGHGLKQVRATADYWKAKQLLEGK